MELNIADRIKEQEEIEEYPLKIQDAIRNRQVVAVSDASMDRNLLATHWIITMLENNIGIESSIKNNK